jgi:superfamily II DNA or RNA helicase
MESYSSERLLDYGPHEFRRAIQRLLLQLNFDAFSVDGSGDGGADLFCERDGQRWVIQSKWKKNGAVGKGAIEEVLAARAKYNAHVAIVVTNSRFQTSAKDYCTRLRENGVEIDLWNGDDIRGFAKDVSPSVWRELRNYQQEAYNCIIRDLNDRGTALLFLGTGLGKTVIAGSIIRKYLENFKSPKILILAHMNELVEQLQKSIWADIPLAVSTQLVNAINQPNALPGVTIATNLSIEKYINAGYRPDLIVVDECHHVGEENTYGRILSQLDDVPTLGVTATPWRGDKFSVEGVFGEPSYVCGIEEGLKEGYLSPVDYRLYCDNINWDIIPDISQHSYSIKDLNRKLFVPARDERIIDGLTSIWHEIANPKCIIFCQSISHAKSIAKKLRSYNHWRDTELLHSEMKVNDRKFALLNFRSDVCPVLVAVDILNEGVDIPNVNIVCFARVTHSRKIFVQQLGRGLRISPGKEKVIVLDYAADIRRVAALSHLNAYLSKDSEVEELKMPSSKIDFSDMKAKSLIDEWILDAADLETSAQETELQFPNV